MANDDLMETPNLGRGEQIDVAAMAAADRARTAASETPVALQLLSALTSKAPRRTSPDIPTSNNSISMASKAGMNALQKAFTEFPNLVENLGSETKAFRIVHDLMGAVSPFMPSGDTNVKNITPSQESKLIDGIEALDNALPQGQSEENIRLNTRRNPYSPEALGGRSISAPSPISTPSPIRPRAQPPLPPPSPPPPQIRPQLPAGPPMQARRPPVSAPVSAPVRPPVSAPSSIPMPTVPTGPAINPMQQGIAPAALQRAPITATGPGYAGGVPDAATKQEMDAISKIMKDPELMNSFREAFDAATRSGKATFEWQGRIFQTKPPSGGPSTTAPARR